MTARQIAYGAVLVPFVAFTAYVLETAGLVGFYREIFRSPSTLLAGVDLLISLCLVVLWMRGDARATGTPLLPYVAVTLAIGSAGPLLYLIHREARQRSPRASAAMAAAARRTS